MQQHQPYVLCPLYTLIFKTKSSFCIPVQTIRVLRRRTSQGRTRLGREPTSPASTSTPGPHSSPQLTNPQSANELSTVCPSSYGILVADIHGSLHVLNKEFEPAMSWIAHVGGRVTHMVERRGFLITVGVSIVSLVPVWIQEKDGKLMRIRKRMQ